MTLLEIIGTVVIAVIGIGAILAAAGLLRVDVKVKQGDRE